MTYRYSPGEGAFFVAGVHPEDEIPADAVGVTDEQFEALKDARAAGMQIAMIDGIPTAVERVLNVAQMHDTALSMITAKIADVASIFTAGLPRETLAAWSTKAAHARTVMAGGSSNLIDAEAQLSGRSVADLAARVVARADLYELTISKLDGLRSAAWRDVIAATDKAGIEAARDAVLDGVNMVAIEAQTQSAIIDAMP